MPDAKVLLLMGVAGSGKTTVGKLVASQLGWPLFDGDDYHPAANRQKMARGEALDDRDREPWLLRLRQLIDQRLSDRDVTGAVVACSALKENYRQTLGCDRPKVFLAFLDGPAETIQQRLDERSDHFFPPELLASQLEALEAPTNGALRLDLQKTPDQLCREIVAALAD